MSNDIPYGTHEEAEASMVESAGAVRRAGSFSDRPRREGQALVADLCDVAGIEPYDHPSDSEHRHLSRRLIGALAIFVTLLLHPMRATAADLRPETTRAWQEYVKAAEARSHEHLVPGSPFLSIDAAPAQAVKLRQGEIVASPAAPNVPVKVQGGLIHDWTGAIYIPSVSISDVLRVVRDYGQYKAVYHPTVVSAKPLQTGDWDDRFSMVVMNKSFFAKSALDSAYRSVFTRVDDQRWYSISETTRVQEVADYGSPSQYTLPEGHGTGIIWQLYSIARYEERDGGVFIELEAIALSREIPSAFAWLVDPIVRRVSKSSLVTSLQQTADAARFGTTTISRSTDPSRPARRAISGSAVNVSATTMRSVR
jgi:hypothetical protein